VGKSYKNGEVGITCCGNCIRDSLVFSNLLFSYFGTVYNLLMRKKYWQVCVDNIMEIQSDPVDVVDLLLEMPKMEARLWKHMWNNCDANNHLATTQKELADQMGTGAPKVSMGMKGLVKKEMVQRNGIHFYVNPWHVWFGEEGRKDAARVEWDMRKQEGNNE
jgi:hypothetical protein